MGEKQQWKLRVEKQLIDRLTRLGKPLGYQSGNEFAADALDEWAELLAEIMSELQQDQAASKTRIRDKVLGQLRPDRRK